MELDPKVELIKMQTGLQADPIEEAWLKVLRANGQPMRLSEASKAVSILTGKSTAQIGITFLSMRNEGKVVYDDTTRFIWLDKKGLNNTLF